jgi:hypothetical protein
MTDAKAKHDKGCINISAHEIDLQIDGQSEPCVFCSNYKKPLKKIEDYSIRDHGVDGEQYFQGAGVAFTKWKDCFTGIGDSPGEALEDALEQLACAGEYDAESLPEGWDEGLLKLTDDKIRPILEKNCECSECKNEQGARECTRDCDCFAQSELHYYVTIFVR